MADQDYPSLYADLEASSARARAAAISFETMLGGSKDQTVPVNGFPDQKTVEGRLAAMVDAKSLEPVVTTVAAGLAATKGTGDSNRFFRVPSADEIYESRYRNDAGVATLIGQIFRTSERLGSIIPNGSFRNLGAGNTYYGDQFPLTALQVPVKAVTEPTLNALGCNAGFELAASDTRFTGNFIEVDVSSIGHERTLQAFASLLVYSPDGTFDFGTLSGEGPLVYRVLSDGTIAGTKMTQFVQLSANVRQYYIFWAGTVPASTLSIRAYRVGLVTSLPRARTYVATGIWLSVAPAAQLPSGTITLAETRWPNWSTGPASPVGAAKALDDRIALQTRVTNLETPPDKGLTALAKALRNPMHSVVVGLGGDSISHGSGSVYVPGANPIPAYDVNNPKINFTMKSWANQYRRNLGETYSEGVVMVDGVPKDAVVQDGAGGGYYDKVHLVDALDGNPNFRWVNAVSGKTVTPTPVASSGALFGKYLDMAQLYRPEFDLVGNNLTIIHAQFTSTNPSAVKQEVWDLLTNTKLGEFSWVGSSVAFGKESTITFPWGRYRIQIRDASTGTEFRLRFEGFKVTQRIEVINYGVSGSGTMSWLPGSANLNQLASRVEFVKIMLGTNDRGNTSQTPLNSSKTKANIKTIVNYLTGQGKKVIVMCASVAIKTAEKPENPDYYFAMNDVMRALREASNELGVDFIDNYTPTRKAVLDGETIFSGTDYLHPNDAGHKIMYDNIVRRVHGAQP